MLESLVKSKPRLLNDTQKELFDTLLSSLFELEARADEDEGEASHLASTIVRSIESHASITEAVSILEVIKTNLSQGTERSPK
jgi:hypothetical protein